MPASLAYHNGQWRPTEEIAVRLDDYGFLMGVTVVERLRTFHGIPYRVAEHIARLRRSLEIVGWDAAGLAEEVEAAVENFAEHNADAMQADDEWGIVAFVTPGDTVDARQPNVCVHGAPLKFALWARQYEQGVCLEVVDVRQTPVNCWPAELKCRSRMHYYLADRQAAERRPGARALLLDQRGYVAEASTANVVAYFPERGLVTPRRENVLPGVSLAVVEELAGELGFPLQEADLTPEEFASADEALLVSTSICVLPIVQIDGAPIGTGQPGQTYRRLLEAWSKHVGVEIADQARQRANA